MFKLVDTCAAEFEAVTPYYYSTYESEDEATTGERPRVVILGGGPNRIGQGIEFDYCCCQAAFALKQTVTKWSWSTRTPRRSAPTTTRRTGCSSSR